MSSPDQCEILHLNDDCFYHIYNFLPIVDWCSLRDTCTRLRTISDYCFERQRETFDLRSIADSWNNLQFSEVKRVLRSFGGFMKTLSINQRNFSVEADFNVLVLFLDRYCHSLLDLKLINFNLTVTTIAQCSRLYSSLQRLVIDQWDEEEAFAGCLDKCVSLTELELIRLFNIAGDSLSNQCIESLTSFKMSSCHDLRYEAVISFLTINNQLTQLKLFNVQFRDRHDAYNILNDVANTLPKLETLSLKFNNMVNLLPLVEMKSLKKLEVNLTNFDPHIVNSVLRGLAVRNIIEDLHLAVFECSDQSIELLSSLKSLKILKLTETIQLDTNKCKRLATELSGLHEIHIIECKDISFIDVKEFCVQLPRLRRIVFNRPVDADPSITDAMFSSIADIRKNQATKDILLIFLNDDDLREIESEFKWSGKEDALTEQKNVLMLMPLEKEHRSAVFEYGSGFRPSTGRGLFVEIEDEDEDDMSYYGNFSDYNSSSDDYW